MRETRRNLSVQKYLAKCYWAINPSVKVLKYYVGKFACFFERLIYLLLQFKGIKNSSDVKQSLSDNPIAALTNGSLWKIKDPSIALELLEVKNLPFFQLLFCFSSTTKHMPYT